MGWRNLKIQRGLHTTIYKHICARKHDQNSLSRFCWGANGSRKGGVRAVFGYQNIEQLRKDLEEMEHNINPMWIQWDHFIAGPFHRIGNVTNTYVVYKSAASSLIQCPNISNNLAVTYLQIPSNIPLGIFSTESRTVGPGKWCVFTPCFV